MDSLQDLLGKHARREPPEIKLAQQYITEHFKADALVTVQETTVTVTVTSASLAGALRLRLPSLQAACGTTKRFIFRIG